MRKVLDVIFLVLFVFAMCVAFLAPTSKADTCGTLRLGIGGFNGGWEDSRYVLADTHIGYWSYTPEKAVFDLQGVAERHRAVCQSGRIVIVGHSLGAAIAHTWAERNPDFGNVLLVLNGSPRQLGGTGWPTLGGPSGHFGGNQVIQNCNYRFDLWCDTSVLSLDGHGAYDNNAYHYG